MRNITKMGLCIAGLIIMAIIAQIRLGNEPALILGGILIFGIGYGYYAKCAKIDLNNAICTKDEEVRR